MHQPPLLDKTANLALRVIEVAENTGPCRTGHHTGRLKGSLYAMPAKIAFICDALDGMAKARPIGTGRYTITAIDTYFRIYQDQPVFGLVGRTRHRTCRHTGGFITLHAIGRLKM